MGRQRKNVEMMVGLGIKQEDICLMVRDAKDKPIALKTLLKHFRKELDQGAAMLNARVGNFIVATMLGTHPEGGAMPITNEHARVSLLQLYARSRMGWRETVLNQNAGKDRGTIVVQIAKGDENL
jgi:hypothetical protein